MLLTSARLPATVTVPPPLAEVSCAAPFAVSDRTPFRVETVAVTEVLAVLSVTATPETACWIRLLMVWTPGTVSSGIPSLTKVTEACIAVAA